MSSPSPDVVLTERRGPVLLVTINRPEARNAVNEAVSLALGDAVEEASDPEVRALVLTGAGDRSFSAGADLKAIMRGERIVPAGREAWGFGGFVDHFTSVPTIAAVNGTALGGGCELALSCDLVVAAQSATFGLPEVTRGLVAAAGGAFRIVQQVPHRVGLRMMLTGEPIGADEALRWGLVNEVVPDAEVVDAALGLATRIAQNAPLAVQASKRIAYGARGGTRTDEQDAWALTTEEMALVITSHDAIEGATAFAEKRAPVWQAR